MSENKVLYGSRKTVKVEVQNHRKIVLVGSFKEVSRTLGILRNILGNRPIGSISDEEFAIAMRKAERINEWERKRRS